MIKTKIALTCGDPAGVGPEIIARLLAEKPTLVDKVVAIGPQNWLKDLPCEKSEVGEEDFCITPGKPTPEGHRLAIAAMERAAKGTRDGEFSAVVTGPINKSGLRSVGFAFPGQTEFFASRWGGTPVMAFAGGKMNVTLATWHIPFKDVPSELDFATLERAVEQADFLARKMKWIEKDVPVKIGVCGLNPHAGEGGILGSEEIDLVEPVLMNLRKRFPALSACVPADTIFRRHLLGEFDAVVALYHDQALAPIKTLEFEESVNISLGLKHIRTSPDHGTAYDIAGKGVAQTKSLENAIRVAEKLI